MAWHKGLRKDLGTDMNTYPVWDIDNHKAWHMDLGTDMRMCLGSDIDTRKE